MSILARMSWLMRAPSSAWGEAVRTGRGFSGGATGSTGGGVTSTERSPSIASAVGKPQTLQCNPVIEIGCSQMGQLDGTLTTFPLRDVNRGLNLYGCRMGAG